MAEIAIIAIGVTILLGFAGNVLFQKTSIPNTLWLLLFGIILGTLNFSGESFIFESAGLIGAIAIIGILSDGGMHLDLKKVISQGFIGILLMFSGIVFSIISTFALLLLFGFPSTIALLVGIIIAGSSSSVIIPMILSMKGISEKLKTILSIESISDNFSVVIALVMINHLGQGTQLSANGAVQGSLLKCFSAITIGIIFGLLWAPLISRLKKYEFSYTATLSAFILLYAFTEILGSSGAIAIFFGGIMLANAPLLFNSLFPEKKFEQLDEDLSKTHALVAFMIRVFFFVYLGMIVGLPKIEALAIGLAITLLIAAGRMLYISFFARRKMLEISELEKKVTIVMVPRGLSAAVLAVFALSAGVFRAQEIVQIVFSVILFSILFTTLAAYFLKSKKGAPVKPVIIEALD
ncbi:MAG: cation:proton antiporter [Candidatus Diapherotrites archaeon]|nr:cation:proton antiporter [Candidatus Diapherotrites archaeon]